LSDVDVTDTHTSQPEHSFPRFGRAAPNPTADPGTLVVSALNQSADTADWTYAVADSALDFLSAGETLIITYDVIVQDRQRNRHCCLGREPDRGDHYRHQ
jgi:hypothetical protein